MAVREKQTTRLPAAGMKTLSFFYRPKRHEL